MPNTCSHTSHNYTHPTPHFYMPFIERYHQIIFTPKTKYTCSRMFCFALHLVSSNVPLFIWNSILIVFSLRRIRGQWCRSYQFRCCATSWTQHGNSLQGPLKCRLDHLLLVVKWTRVGVNRQVLLNLINF